MPTLPAIRAAFRWDARAQRYRRPSGQFVPQADLTAALRQFAANAGRGLQRLTAELVAGNVSLADWQERAADRVKSIHLAMSAAAAGGFDRMTASDYGKVGNRLRYHYGRLLDFARKLEARTISDAQAVARAALFGAAGNLTYQNARLDAAVSVFTEGRRVLSVTGEHCPGCIAEATKGWLPVGLVKPLGLDPCKMNCRCSCDFR